MFSFFLPHQIFNLCFFLLLCLPPPPPPPPPQVLVVSWRSQQLKQYNWEGRAAAHERGEEERKGKDDREGERGRGKCVRSWRPLQGSVVSMAIDSTSTLLATGSENTFCM